MSLRTFIIGLASSFGLAWLAIVVIPFFKMRNLEPIPFEGSDSTAGVFFPKRTGRIADGAQVYAANGCYLCHTQVVRPTYAGKDMFRADWGGLANDKNRGDTRRETNAFDFMGEDFAHIGVTRMGPDLSNFGRRLEAKVVEEGLSPEAWVYKHLYDPQSFPALRLSRSTCPPHPFLFKKREIKGAPSNEAVDVEAGDGYEIVAGSDAKALTSYLLSLKKDHPVPSELDFAPADK